MPKSVPNTEFKRGEIVRVKNNTDEKWKIRLFCTYYRLSTHPFVTYDGISVGEDYYETSTWQQCEKVSLKRIK